MWLTSSSVGRKFVMAVSGAALVLFVTFHCLMNSVAILWPTAYNLVCEFLGANWYALVASAGLAALIIIHIVYAVCLTIQNRKARGHNRYLITKRPKTVEWSSKNMLVLGIVILAFMGIHLWQFWTKMQMMEVCGMEGPFPAAAGTLYLSLAFGEVWTICVYVVAFVALWLHMTHGFWSMFQSVGWDSTRWIPRLKCIGWWWATIVCLLFIAEAGVFTFRAMDGYYYDNPALRAQYAQMIGGDLNQYAEYDEKDMFNENVPFDTLLANVNAKLGELSDPNAEQQELTPKQEKFIEKLKAAQTHLTNIVTKGEGICGNACTDPSCSNNSDATAPAAIIDEDMMVQSMGDTLVVEQVAGEEIVNP